jgi:ABC-type nitrate/sulfonate/bicarbonate transport system ATPase subunit
MRPSCSWTSRFQRSTLSTKWRSRNYLVDAWLEEPRTVIYVTHDIDEAIYLADRIAIMTPSPGRIAHYVNVNLERPRDRNSAEANRLRAEITEIMHRLESGRDLHSKAS